MNKPDAVTAIIKMSIAFFVTILLGYLFADLAFNYAPF